MPYCPDGYVTQEEHSKKKNVFRNMCMAMDLDK